MKHGRGCAEYERCASFKHERAVKVAKKRFHWGKSRIAKIGIAAGYLVRGYLKLFRATKLILARFCRALRTLYFLAVMPKSINSGIEFCTPSHACASAAITSSNY